MELNTLLQSAGEISIGAAIGFGSFMGYTKANMKTLKEMLILLNQKMDRLDMRLDKHDIKLAQLPCQMAIKECIDAPRKESDPPK